MRHEHTKIIYTHCKVKFNLSNIFHWCATDGTNCCIHGVIVVCYRHHWLLSSSVDFPFASYSQTNTVLQEILFPWWSKWINGSNFCYVCGESKWHMDIEESVMQQQRILRAREVAGSNNASCVALILCEKCRDGWRLAGGSQFY